MDETADKMTSAVRNELGRRYVESAEAWLRKIIHFQLYSEATRNYITQGQWKKSIKESVATKANAVPGGLSREIDGTTFEQAVDIVCHPDWWNSKFKQAFSKVYPLGYVRLDFSLSK